jgi:hypothetical protein
VFAATDSEHRMQLVASAVKVPALFLLTLVVTLPSLYVFTALVNARLSVGALVRLFVAAIGVNIAVLASLGPIVAFFSLNTVSYNFMVLLNVLVFAVSGVLGLAFLLQTLHRLNIAPRYERTALDRMVDAHRAAQLAKSAAGLTPPPISPGELPPALERYITPEVVEPGGTPPQPSSPQAAEPSLAEPPASPTASTPDELSGPLDPIAGHVLGRHTRLVFDCWVLVFGLVGAQMSWVLRPFIGSPDIPFEWFRPRSSNFFEAVFQALRSLLMK